MLSCELQRGELSIGDGCQPVYDISGIIGLSGKAAGTVVLSLSREAAIQATATMLGETPDDLNGDVVDAVGELTNMIAGAAKAELEQLQMSVSLPNVIIGRNHCIQFPTGVKPICIPFESSIGALSVEFGLKEET